MKTQVQLWVRLKVIDLVTQINLDFGVLLSIYPVSEKDFIALNSPLLRNIRKEGAELLLEDGDYESSPFEVAGIVAVEEADGAHRDDRDDLTGQVRGEVLGDGERAGRGVACRARLKEPRGRHQQQDRCDIGSESPEDGSEQVVGPQEGEILPDGHCENRGGKQEQAEDAQ